MQLRLSLELLNGLQLVFCFYVERDLLDMSDCSTSLQMVLAAMSSQASTEVVRDVYKGENDKNVECCAEQSQAFS